VAAPTVTSLFAASSGTAGGLLALAGTGFALPQRAQFPEWNILSALLLLLALAWDVWLLSGRRRPVSAFLLTLSAAWLVLAELWRLPFSSPESWQWVAMATGLPLFLSLPLRTRPWPVFWPLFSVALAALAAVFALQELFGMAPCPLCWVQRGALLAFAVTALLPVRLRFWCAQGASIVGLAAASWQFLEVSRVVHQAGVCVHGVSCVSAGSAPLPILGIPVIDVSLAFFSLFWTAALFIPGGREFPSDVRANE
jgi:hypothetical protein